MQRYDHDHNHEPLHSLPIFKELGKELNKELDNELNKELKELNNKQNSIIL